MKCPQSSLDRAMSRELTWYAAQFMETRTWTNLGSTTRFFHRQYQAEGCWREKLHSLGFPLDWFRLISQSQVISHYGPWFDRIEAISEELRLQIRYPWELLCLTADDDLKDKLWSRYRLSSEDIGDSKGEGTPLFMAAFRASPEGMQHAIDDFELSPLIVSEENQLNALHFAAIGWIGKPHEKTAAMEKALSLGIDPHQVTGRGFHFGHLSAFSGSVDAIKLALNCNVDLRLRARGGINMLQAAALGGSYAVMTYVRMALLNQGIFDITPETQDQAGRDAYWYAKQSNKPMIARALRDRIEYMEGGYVLRI